MVNTENKEAITFYRYDSIYYESGPVLHLTKYHSVKETPKGYWVVSEYIVGNYDNYKGLQKWTSKTGRKRFAYPTEQEALYSFIRRKQLQVKILNTQLKNSSILLGKANRLYTEKYKPNDQNLSIEKE